MQWHQLVRRRYQWLLMRKNQGKLLFRQKGKVQPKGFGELSINKKGNGDCQGRIDVIE